MLVALRCETPGAARRVLKFVCGDPVARMIRDEIDALALGHSSEVVRWKALRTIALLGKEPSVGQTFLSAGPGRQECLPNDRLRRFVLHFSREVA